MNRWKNGTSEAARCGNTRRLLTHLIDITDWRAPMESNARPTADERFWSKVELDAPSGCWIWTAGKSYGYGSFAITGSRRVASHRYAYETMIGEIPDGLQLDHLCRNRACVNPWHLDPVTSAVNSLRGENPTVIAHHTNTCKHGHTLADAYVRVRRANGKPERMCRTCSIAASRQQSKRKTAARKALRDTP